MSTKKSIKEFIQISAPVAQTKESCYNEPKQIKQQKCHRITKEIISHGHKYFIRG